MNKSKEMKTRKNQIAWEMNTHGKYDFRSLFIDVANKDLEIEEIRIAFKVPSPLRQRIFHHLIYG